MEIKLQKEIRNYSESIFFGLSLRQFSFAALALGCSVVVYFLAHGVLHDEIVGWLCILAALPGAAMGFFRYQGLTAEAFVRAAFRYLFAPAKLPRKNTNIYYEITKGGEN